MRTVNNLRLESSFIHDWQTKELSPIEDLSEVIINLLTKRFVVEIDGHMYDLSFGYNEEENEISYAWSSAPSPHLKSWEIINRAFKEGKWFSLRD